MRGSRNRSSWSALGLVLGGVVGGFLLASWLNRRPQRSVPLQGWDAARRTTPTAGPANPPGEPSNLPSARLGATEEQMDHTMRPPAPNPVRSGDVSVAGAVHELDPKGISPG
ncbi:MAG TPA: hypothetical protein PKE45_16920 [Caldilineaceae bacterium]|nr:hypothetical protein [Caldilineaceae bacterium]